MTMSKANCSSSSSAFSPLSASTTSKPRSRQPLGHQRPERGLVVDEEQMGRGIGHLRSANMLTQNPLRVGSNGLAGGTDTAFCNPS